MKIETEALLSHTSSVRVRYAETDKMGVVYNGNYLTYFEIGRTELLRMYGLPYSELELSGFLLPVLEAKATYYKPAYYDDIITIKTSMYWASAATIRMEYRLFRNNELITEGYTLHAFISAKTRNTVRPPKIFHDILHKTEDNI